LRFTDPPPLPVKTRFWVCVESSLLTRKGLLALTVRRSVAPDLGPLFRTGLILFDDPFAGT